METMMRLANEKLTLCEVIRLINDNFQEENESAVETRNLLCLALFMAKRMACKLREYNEQWDADWIYENRAYRRALMRAEKTYHVGSKDLALQTLEKIGKQNESIIDTICE